MSEQHGRVESDLPRRLGRNLGRYEGDCVDIDAVLRDLEAVAGETGWEVEKITAAPGLELLALHRRVAVAAPVRCYLSTGIHGDEPAGPLAILELLREDRWPREVELWVCPCLNPTGFRLNQRASGTGIDLNRDYRRPRSAEVQAHIRWLDALPVLDVSACLHEDWEAHGFYLYELNPHGLPSAAEAIVTAVAPVCPIDSSELIDGREARLGIIRPQFDPGERLDWPEAIYLIQQKSRHNYTLEAPSDFALPVRVRALKVAVERLLGG